MSVTIDFSRAALLAPLALVVACQRDAVEPLRESDLHSVPAYLALTQEFGFGKDSPEWEQVTEALPFERISLWRSGCYGSCPVYRVDYYKDGRVVYLGEDYVDHVGRFDFVDALSDFALLAANVEMMGLLALDAEYAAGWTDDETVTLEIEGPFGVRRIEDYGRQGPPLLRAFHDLVDRRTEELFD